MEPNNENPIFIRKNVYGQHENKIVLSLVTFIIFCRELVFKDIFRKYTKLYIYVKTLGFLF